MAVAILSLPARLVLGAASAALLAPAPGAQEELPAAPPAAAEERADDTSRARERVLHLSNGQLVRGRTRFADGRWELERDRGWDALGAGAVERAVPVKDLEREADRRTAKLRPTDADGRAAHAAWLLTQGLVPECVAELDRVLGLDPTHHGARELVRQPRLRIGLPPTSRPHLSPQEGLRSYLRLAGRLGPAGRALAARELQAAPPEGVVLLDELTAALIDPSIPTRTLAAQALGQLFPGQAVGPLYRRAILDTQEPVRTEATLALRAVGHEAIAIPALDALRSDSGVVRTHAADALALLGFPHAVPALVSALAPPPPGGGGGVASHGYIAVTTELAYVRDMDVEIAQGASIARPIVDSVSSGVILDARVLGVQMYTLQIQEIHIRRALEHLTGVKPGRSARAWADWWAEQGEGFLEGLGGPSDP